MWRSRWKVLALCLLSIQASPYGGLVPPPFIPGRCFFLSLKKPKLKIGTRLLGPTQSLCLSVLGLGLPALAGIAPGGANASRLPEVPRQTDKEIESDTWAGCEF